MKKQTLMHSSILAAVIIAAVTGVGMVSGFLGVKPFISVDPVSDKNTGDQFTLTGTTNLPAGTEILVDIHPSSFDPNTGMFSDPKTGAAIRLDPAMAVAGILTVDTDPDGVAAWSFDVPSTAFLTGEYTVTVYEYNKNKPGPGAISGVTTFTVHDTAASPASAAMEQYIRIDPVGDRNVGDAFTVTGTTNLPAGTEILFQVYSASFEPTAANPQASGFFTGATGTLAVTQGTGGTNTWSADLDTSTFEPAEYRVTAAELTGDAKKGDFSTGMVSDKTLFTLHPASGAGGTSPRSDHTVTGGILIDPIRDTNAGDLLVVTGKADLSAGTDLIVKVVPVSLQNGKITGDYQNPENIVVTKVVKGSGINNRFSVAIDTRLPPPAEHMISVSNVKGTTAGIDSEPGSITMSLPFTIIAGKAGTAQPRNGSSVPSVFINPFSDVTAGDSLVVSGTTNLPVGARFRVSVIPSFSTDYEHPELAAKISAVKGSPAGNLFSVTLRTEDLPRGEHILFVSAEDAEVTGSILFTVN